MDKMFQTSLFGYSKKSVSAYIASLNEEFSQKLLEKDLEHKKVLQDLTQQLETLAEENRRLNAAQQEVADALIDAKAFAAGLKAQAQEEDEAQRAKNQVFRQAELQQLQDISDSISTLRRAFHAVIRDMDVRLGQYDAQCQDTYGELRAVTPDQPEPSVSLLEEEKAGENLETEPQA